MKRLSTEASDVNEVVAKLKEENSALETQLQESKKTIADLDNELSQFRDKRSTFNAIIFL